MTRVEPLFLPLSLSSLLSELHCESVLFVERTVVSHRWARKAGDGKQPRLGLMHHRMALSSMLHLYGVNAANNKHQRPSQQSSSHLCELVCSNTTKVLAAIELTKVFGREQTA